MAQNEYRIDNRTTKDIQAQVQKLAKSYVPEWKFDEKQPDIGSVLALIFAEQLKGNVERLNTLLERYHTELVNLLDISLLPAHPAKATVLMDLIPDTVAGVQVPKGTKLLADSEQEKVIFETAYSVYMTGSKISAIFMTSGTNGHVVPVFGDFEETAYVPIEKDDKESVPEKRNLEAFNLFDFSKGGIEKQAVLLYHDSIFDVENELLDCKITGNPKFLKDIEKGKYKIKYYCEEGFLEVENYQIINEHIYFSKEKESKKVEIDGKGYSLIIIEAQEPGTETIMVETIEFSSSGSPRTIEYAGNGTTDYDVKKFDVFGDTLALYSECYIGMDSYFSKKDAKITLAFNTKYVEKYVGLVKAPEQQDLRIIKRKKRFQQEETMAYTFAQEITIEYFNGIGWKRLNCDKEYTNLFKECEAGRIELSFICPRDWEETSVGGYQGRILRIQLIKADNCYYQPCMHCYPRIIDMNISYTYNDKYEKPAIGTRMYGTAKQDLTKDILEHKPFPVFSKGNYQDTAIYLGFDKVFENGPVSLWWKLKDSIHDARKKLRFYYSTNSEFKEMKLVDYTENLSKTGVMLFIPQPDMGMLTLEEKRLCWIKIVEENPDELQACPMIERLALNAVEVKNIETMEKEEFYLDTVSANMSFPIRADHILDADVWVNEVNELTKADMQYLMTTQPDKVKATLNYLGEIEEFFVKWEECSSFRMLEDYSRHYILDRMQNRIIFGDGVNVRIPRNTEGTAFTVQAHCCNGSEGNVLAEAIADSNINLMFVNHIYNPNPAYGGSDMEKLENALERGASLLSSGGRFVTEQDYISEIKSFSENVEQVSIVRNVDRVGRYKDGMLCIVLLMKDFTDGSASFYGIQSDLKQHLLSHCELSLLPEKLMIEEPLFVELNVDVWVQLMQLEDSFEVQNQVTKTLNSYLNPIAEPGRKGWEIGTLPRKSQIMMRLNSIKSKGIMSHLMITARYTDRFGTHEVDLDDLKATPFMVVKSGVHKVHLIQS
jgi:hypothetical protein